MTLNIEVGANHRLTSDAFNVIIQQKGCIDPKASAKWEVGDSTELIEEWRSLSWHATVDKALAALLERRVRESNAESLKDLRSEIRCLRSEMSGLYGLEEQTPQ